MSATIYRLTKVIYMKNIKKSNIINSIDSVEDTRVA